MIIITRSKKLLRDMLEAVKMIGEPQEHQAVMEALTGIAIFQLSMFVQKFLNDGVKTIPEFNKWKKEHLTYIEDAFDYKRREGMPSITNLVKPFFHPTLPLVGLNYTQLAHNTLYEFPSGWTIPLRLCRGVVFDYSGNLVALPFPKFFNFGEHPESRTIPEGKFEATIKRDGHLGIIFKYQGKFILTTRGSFESPTVRLTKRMLNKYAKDNNWKDTFPANTTVLVEIIHPKTMVYVNYGRDRRFELIGAYDHSRNIDYDHEHLEALGEQINLLTVPVWMGDSKGNATISDLRLQIKNRSYFNEEGFVVRFENGTRVKFKYDNYIGLMVKDKLSAAYLMQRMISGNLERMLLTLPEEIYSIALRMLGEIMLKVSAPGELKDKWRSLYDLPHTTSDSHFKGICREFVKQTMKANI